MRHHIFRLVRVAAELVEAAYRERRELAVSIRALDKLDRYSTRTGMGLALLALTACSGEPAALTNMIEKQREPEFPAADRPVATIVSARWSTEEARDRLNEANKVMDLAGIKPGMTVADIGAGEGYYTIRLGDRVGARGRVLAQDIVPAVRDALAARVARERLANVSVKLGLPEDPRLPPGSFDRVLMVHMYHEIAEPYEFLWRLRPALKPDGEVIVVDADRPTQNHGTPPALLECEFAAVGYKRVSVRQMPSAGGYFAVFKLSGERPAPDDIIACRLSEQARAAQGEGTAAAGQDHMLDQDDAERR